MAPSAAGETIAEDLFDSIPKKTQLGNKSKLDRSLALFRMQAYHLALDDCSPHSRGFRGGRNEAYCVFWSYAITMRPWNRDSHQQIAAYHRTSVEERIACKR